MSEPLFTEDQKNIFIESVKTGFKKRQIILDEGLSLSEAFTYAYLDISRKPLRGIGNSVGNPTAVRKQCIDEMMLYHNT